MLYMTKMQEALIPHEGMQDIRSDCSLEKPDNPI